MAYAGELIWNTKTGKVTMGMTPKERRIALKALKEMNKNMTPDQQERRIMATINGTKVLIVVTREMPKREE